MPRLILLNKPYDMLCQFTDKGTVGTARRTLSDVLPVKGVYPAGRLDRDSEGLVLLTDDGRLQARIDTPGKQWKFSMGDLAVRDKWDDYQRAYGKALAATSTAHAPWYVIPADSKRQRNLMVARLLVKTLKDMKIATPPGDPALQGRQVV